MSDPIQQPADDIKYPAWQPQCRAVMMEIDPERIMEKLAEAEMAMFARMQELTRANGNGNSHAELRALREDAEALRTMTVEVLGYPDFKK